jgi:arylsulfatase A-like enzyme
MPTFLELGGVAVPDRLEGQSLLPLLRDESKPWRSFIHGEHAPCWQFVTDGREKYIWNSQSGEEWLFNLAEDPRECHNLVSLPAAQPQLDIWRERLVGILAERPEDQLVQDGKLVSGRTLPPTRPFLGDRA